MKLPPASTRFHWLACLAFAVGLTPGFSQSSWNWNGSVSGNWSDSGGANWTLNSAGGSSLPQGYLNFPSGPSQLLTTNDFAAYSSAFQIYFNSGASSYTLSGNPVKFYDWSGTAAAIQNDSANTQTINFLFGAGNSVGININPNAGDLVITGSTALFLDGPSQIRVNGNSGSTATFNVGIGDGTPAGGSFALNGPATAIFNGANTYTGDTFINNGTLQFNSSGSLASGTIQLGDTANANNATLSLAPVTGGYSIGRPVVVRSGNSGVMTISSFNTSGTNLLSGGLTLNKALTVTNVGGGTLAFSGATALGANQLAVTGAGETRFSGTTTASAVTSPGIVMNGSGKLTIATAGDNTSLQVTANSGTVELGGTTANQTALVNVNGGTVRLTGTGTDQQIWNSGTLNISGGTFDQNGKTETVGTLRLTNGVITGSGTLTVSAAAIDAQAGSSATVLAGTVGLTKTTASTVTLSVQNTYSGGTTINGGILDLTGGGGASGTIRGTVTINTSGTLRLSTGDATGYNGGSSSLTPINIAGGTLNVNTVANMTLGSAVVNMTGGSITGVTGGNLDFFGGTSALNTLASSTTSTISGVPISPLRQGSTTFTVAAGTTPSGIDLDISSVIRTSPSGDAANSVLIKAGGGTMRLVTNNTFARPIAVNAGKLVGASGGSCPNSVVTVANGATNGVQLLSAGGQWTCGGLVIGVSGADFSYGDFDLGSFTASGSVAPLQVNGNVTFVGRYGVIVRNTTLAVGTYPLIKYTGTLAGPLPTFPVSVPGGVVASITNNTANKSLDLVVTSLSAPTTATWATTSGTWDINTTANWTNASGTPINYEEGNAVLFNNPASASTVTLNATVNPAAVSNGVAFNNTANYTISGSGAIAGLAGLMKSGSGELILATPNTFSGGTILNGGTIRASASDAALGTGPLTVVASGKLATASGGGARTLANPLIVASNQTLSLDAGFASLTLNGPISGAGSLSHASGGTVTLGGVSTITNAVAIANSSTLVFASGSVMTNLGGGINVSPAGSGNTLNIQSGASVAALYLRTGDNGSGNNSTVNQTGGTLTLRTTSSSDIRLGHWTTTGNNYNLLGGTLNVPNANFNNGWDGASTFTIGGGTANLLGLAMIGPAGGASSPSTLILTNGALNIGSSGISRNGSGTKTILLGGGTLGASASWSSTSPMILTGTNGNVTIDPGANTITLSGGLSGAGGLIKNSAGTLNLTGTNTYTGTTVINAGTVQVTTPGYVNLSGAVSGAGTLTNTTGTLDIGGSGTVATNTIGSKLSSAGGRIVYDLMNPASADLIAMTGSPALTLSGTTAITPANGMVTNGTFTLITGAGTITGTAANLVLGATNASQRGTPTATFAVSSPTVTMTISGVATTNLFWQGGASGVWDINTTANWTNAPGGAADKFFNQDNVTFDDTALATANGTNVTISGSVFPGTLRFNNSTKNFTLAGSGNVAGGVALTKSGTGLLTISNANAYTGGTIISAGTLRLATNNATGIGLGPLTLTGGTFDLNSNNVSILTLSGTGGTITDGYTNIGAVTRTLTVNQLSSNTFAGALNNGTSNTVALVKNGTGYLNLSGTASTFRGGVTVNAGTLELNSAGVMTQTIAQGATLKLGYSQTGFYNNGCVVNGTSVSDASGLYILAGKSQTFGNTLTLQNAPSTVRAYGSGTATLSGGDVNSTHISVAAAASGSVIDSAVGISCSSFGYRFVTTAGANTATGDLIVGGVISGSGANGNGGPFNTNWRKEGTGSLLLTNASTYAQGVYVGGGTLILAGGNNRLPATSGVILNSGTVLQLNGISQTLTNVSANGTGGAVVGGSATTSTLTINNAGLNANACAIGGSGANQNNLSFAKTGVGQLILSGKLTYTGNTTISAGTVSASSLTNADGATLSVVDVAGTLSATNLTLGTSAGSTVAITGFASATSAPIIATNLTVNGLTTITLTGVFTSGQYPLIQYVSGTIGGLGSFAVQQSNLPRGVAATIVTNGANKTIDVVLTANALVWVGSTNGVNVATWDNGATTNWSLIGTPNYFTNGDNVLIDDTATGSTTLDLVTTISPFAVLVTNDAKDFTLSASGPSALTGGMSLVKRGSGLLTITESNSFTGGVTIGGGAVNIQNGYAFNTNNVTIASGAELQLQGGIIVPAVTVQTLSSTGTNVTGGLRNIGGNNTNAGPITLGAAARINSDSGTLTLTGGVTAGVNPVSLGGAGNIAIATAGVSGSAGLVKDGSGTNIWSVNPNISSGGMTVNGGTLQINNGNFGGTFTPLITVNPGATLWGNSTHSSGGGAALVLNQATWLMSAEDYKQSLTISDSLITQGPNPVSSGGELRVGSSGGAGSWTWYVTNSVTGSVINTKLNTIAANVNLTLNVARGAAESDLTINGAIINGGNIIFAGDGVTTLAGNNSYSGTTVVSAGTLRVNGTNSGSGSLTVDSGAALTGKGTINGTVTNNGTIAPGISIGTLTLSNAPVLNASLIAEINQTNVQPADLLVVASGTLNYSGTLTVTNIGPALANGVFTLFNAPSYSGAFASFNLPPGGLAHWKTNNLVVDGTISFTNYSPVAHNLTAGVVHGGTVVLPVIGGKNSATDADGDAIAVTAVGTPSSGSVSFGPSNVTYVASGTTGTNTFTYTVTDTLGSSDTKTVTIVVSDPQGFNLLSATSGGGNAYLSYLGIPGTNYALEVTHALPATNWTAVVSNVADGSGHIYFTNLISLLPTNDYYRTRYVP